MWPTNTQTETGEGAGRLSRSFHLGFVPPCPSWAPSEAVRPPWNRDEEHFNTRHFSFHLYFLDVNYTSEDEPQAPSHSSQSFRGFILFQNQCIGLFVRTTSCVWLDCYSIYYYRWLLIWSPVLLLQEVIWVFCALICCCSADQEEIHENNYWSQQ